MLSALLLLSFAPINQNPVIALMQPASVSGMPSAQFHDGSFVLWPHGIAGRNNRLWTLMTGLNWQGLEGAISFIGNPIWSTARYHELQSIGYVQALRYPKVVALTDGPRVSSNALFLALRRDTAAVQTASLNGQWPSGALAIGQARNWDDVALLRSRTSGPVAVVEYPPPLEQNWSRIWLYGASASSPSSPGGVNGLLDAGDIPKALVSPGDLNWAKPNNVYEWLEFQRTIPWLIGCFGAIAAALLTIGSWMVMKERRSGWTAVGLEALIISPASALLAGASGGRIEGSATVLLWLVLTAALLGVAAIARKVTAVHAHPLWCTAIIGLLSSAAGNPDFSIFGTTFVRSANSLPTLPFAAILGYAVWVVAGDPRPGKLQAISLLSIATLALAVGCLWSPWWTRGGPEVFSILLVACLLAEGFWSPYILLALALACGVYVALSGYAPMPFGLIHSFDQVGRVDSFAYVDFLLSPPFIASISLCGLLALFGDRFFLYRMKQLIRLDSRRLVLPRLALAALVVGIFLPAALPLALLITLAGQAVLLHDALSA